MIRDAGGPAASEARLLRVEGVVKRFGGATALNGLMLSLGAGESLGVTGPNGSGKTTLLNVISGVVRPDLGRVWLAGLDITGWPPHLIVRAGVARTCQPWRLPLRLTVEQYVEAATLHRRLGRFRRRRAVNQVLDLTGLTDLRKRDASTLSSGESRRVQVGHVLDPGHRLQDFLRRLRGQGLAILLVAHTATVFQALCDRIAVVEAGRVVRTGSPAEVLRA